MKRIILSEQEIEKLCQRIGAEIEEKIADEEKIPLVVGVMNGAMNFAAEERKAKARIITRMNAMKRRND